MTSIKIKMDPQPLWEQEPFLTKEGTWGGHYRWAIWSYDGLQEFIELDEHIPPSKYHTPKMCKGVWYWKTR